MTIFSALFMIWISTSFFTPYLAIYVIDLLASIVDIKNNHLFSLYDKETNEIREPNCCFEYLVAYQEIIPSYMIFGPGAIILSAFHIIAGCICFIPYYFK